MTAGKCGVFSALKEGPLSAKAIAGLTKCSEIGILTLMRAMAANGFVDVNKEGETTFALNAFSRPFAETGKGGLARILHKEALFYRFWSEMDKVVRTGKALLSDQRIRLREQPEMVATFLGALNDIAATAGDGVIAAAGLRGNERFLDLGCGAGGYSMVFAEAYPELSLTAVDHDRVLKLAKPALVEAGLSDRVQLVASDFRHGRDIPGYGQYDVVFLSHVLHDYPEGDLADLVKAAAACLRPGGRLLVLDVIADAEMEVPAEALFGLMMLMENPGGRTHERRAIEAALMAADLESVAWEKLYFGTLISGTRPA
jgi:SAM-dependent methyltransferase